MLYKKNSYNSALINLRIVLLDAFQYFIHLKKIKKGKIVQHWNDKSDISFSSSSHKLNSMEKTQLDKITLEDCSVVYFFENLEYMFDK